MGNHDRGVAHGRVRPLVGQPASSKQQAASSDQRSNCLPGSDITSQGQRPGTEERCDYKIGARCREHLGPETPRQMGASRMAVAHQRLPNTGLRPNFPESRQQRYEGQLCATRRLSLPSPGHQITTSTSCIMPRSSWSNAWQCHTYLPWKSVKRMRNVMLPLTPSFRGGTGIVSAQ